MQPASSAGIRIIKWVVGFVAALVAGATLIFLTSVHIQKPDVGAMKPDKAETEARPRSSAVVANWYATLGTNVNRHLAGGRTPLMIAAMSMETEEARRLLERGANVNVADNSGRTALYYAVCFGDEATQLVQLLLEHGADVNANDRYGASVLEIARSDSSRPQTKVEELLRRAGATSRWDRVKQ